MCLSVSIILNIYFTFLVEAKCCNFSALFLTSVPHVSIEMETNTNEREQLIWILKPMECAVLVKKITIACIVIPAQWDSKWKGGKKTLGWKDKREKHKCRIPKQIRVMTDFVELALRNNMMASRNLQCGKLCQWEIDQYPST